MIPYTHMATTHYYPIYTPTDNRSDVDKCLDKKILQDIRDKQLKNETLNDEDVERINQCVEENNRSNATAFFVVSLVIVATIVIAIFGVAVFG